MFDIVFLETDFLENIVKIKELYPDEMTEDMSYAWKAV